MGSDGNWFMAAILDAILKNEEFSSYRFKMSSQIFFAL